MSRKVSIVPTNYSRFIIQGWEHKYNYGVYKYEVIGYVLGEEEGKILCERTTEEAAEAALDVLSQGRLVEFTDDDNLYTRSWTRL